MTLSLMSISYSRILITLIVVLWSNTGNTRVEIGLDGKTYTYASNPRLSDVLSPIANSKDWYWTGTAIYQLEDKSVYAAQTKVINSLAMLGQQNTTNKADYQLIIDKIKGFHLAKRIGMDVDFEQARFNPRYNPSFEQGKYLINLQTRPDKLFVTGAVKKDLELNYLNNTCFSEYLNDISKLEIASKDHVYVIQPNGNIQSIGIAYWNEECNLVMPGSQIYFPIEENILFDDVSTVNQSIAKLLSNRILSSEK